MDGIKIHLAMKLRIQKVALTLYPNFMNLLLYQSHRFTSIIKLFNTICTSTTKRTSKNASINSLYI